MTYCNNCVHLKSGGCELCNKPYLCKNVTRRGVFKNVNDSNITWYGFRFPSQAKKQKFIKLVTQRVNAVNKIKNFVFKYTDNCEKVFAINDLKMLILNKTYKEVVSSGNKDN